MKIINCNNKNYLNKLTNVLDLRKAEKKNNLKIIDNILKDIKKNKSKDLLKYERKFSKNNQIKLSKIKINKSIKSLDPKVKRAIDYAYLRIHKFHSKQIKDFAKNLIYVDKFKNKLEYISVPVESVGIYVPGNLPSTLLMNSIPAKLAKVKKIILATPKVSGKLNPAVLYAAKKVGIKEIYCMGGAQAIGPGNQFVAGAKRQLSGSIVGTESMYAGPSEICVLADKKTDINQIITSLVSQAEHGHDSQCILITKDKTIIKKVKKGIKKLLSSLPRKKIAKTSLKKNGLIIFVKSDKQILNVINEIAPEHLEINVKNYKKYYKKIYNAGSICNGRYTPMSVSDYTVGTNHVLPTSGSAKFSSGLNINEFLKKISVVTLSKLGVEKIGNPAITLSEFEQLDGHAQSIKSRMRRY